LIKYPNGKIFKKQKQTTHKSKTEISISSKNRGMAFESEINQSNIYYKNKDICLIYKRPTPINVVKVDYNKGAKITHAYFEEQSTTDYNGVYKGRYIDFEAKNTKSKTSFPLQNIPIHQIEHLKEVIKHNGIAFFIVHFELLNEIYLLDASHVIHLYESNTIKSIKIDYFRKFGYAIKRGYNPRIEYIEAINKCYFE